ncbi:TPA: hypothetical protein PXR53_002772 [Yersinia enterocolitica]|nr:hypothetical protein [Yersinia enterocolitica]
MAGNSFDLLPILSQFGFSILSGGIGAFLTTKIALGKFYKEKWWEKRAIAFNELIQSVYIVKESYGKALDELYEFHDDDSSLSKEDWDKVDLIHLDMVRLSELGPLTLTTHAAKLLKDYDIKRKEINSKVNSSEMEVPDAYATMVENSDSLFKELLHHARKELKISDS